MGGSVYVYLETRVCTLRSRWPLAGHLESASSGRDAARPGFLRPAVTSSLLGGTAWETRPLRGAGADSGQLGGAVFRVRGFRELLASAGIKN